MAWFLLRIFFLFNVLCCVFGLLPRDAIAPSFDECLSNELDTRNLLCRGKRALRNVLRNLNKSDRPIVIVRGLEIVPAKDVTAKYDKRLIDSAISDESILDNFSHYLRTHELNIKFSNLLNEESEYNPARDLEQNDVKLAGASVEARKKDKGLSMLIILALMFAKLLAVMGLGGIGAIAVKALGVSMAALLMAVFMAIKALSQHGGHESSSVQYVTAEGGHHRKRRRRRSFDADQIKFNGSDKFLLPYKAWAQKSTNLI